MRESGVLLPIFALPSKYGIGCFSKEAYEFVDFLKKAGQKNWQILPLGQTGYGDSPYQSFSTFAGNPYFIDLEELIAQGYLTVEECEAFDWGKSQQYVDYEKVYQSRYQVLRLAFDRYPLKDDKKFQKFVKNQAFWLEDYALYTAIKKEQGGKSWMEWDEKLRYRDAKALDKCRKKLSDELQFVRFQQYLFFTQWKRLKKYANKKGIQIIGDIPIYVALDSADTWSDTRLFQFNTKTGEPVAVAGCPPDYFAATGQLWGNPLYDWKYHKKTGYQWWLKRIASCFTLYDVVRVDHFRGFDEYYSIPYGDETAVNGHWEKGPGLSLFTAIKKKMGEVRIIAEDLGYLTDTVRELVRDTGYPGMKVLQFAFDAESESDYLPHKYDKNCIVYTGTHDNDTTRSWYEGISKKDRKFTERYLNYKNMPVEEASNQLIRLAMASVANLCIIPMQDYLNLDCSCRMNTPSTLGDNWKWRLLPGQITRELTKSMRGLAEIYFRCEKKQKKEKANK